MPGVSLGAGLRSEVWERLIEGEEAAILLTPIVAFSTSDVMADMMEEAGGELNRDLLIGMLPISAVGLYEYWQEDRRKLAESLATESADGHTSPRVGRNEPCICGSGKKI